MPLPYDAAPATPTAPTSAVAHGEGSDAGAVPVPLIETASGLEAALLAIVNVACRAPVAAGANVRVTPQPDEAAMDRPLQPSPATAKSCAAPPIVTLAIVSVPGPPFETVTVSGALVVPLCCDGNAIGLGATRTTGCGAPPRSSVYTPRPCVAARSFVPIIDSS